MRNTYNQMTMTSTLPTDMTDETASGKNRATENFPVGSALIRPDLRRHVFAFYNFARAADDISDHPLMNDAEKVRRLDQFASSLKGEDSDVLQAVELRHSLLQTGVSPKHALDLLTAFKRDTYQLRYGDWADLIDYCNYSAAPVGRHVLALHGVGPSAWRASDALCNALQIINHIQDCADDYRELDRVYIPQDMLAQCGGTTADLSAEQSSEGLRKSLQAMLHRMEPLLKDARQLPVQVPDMRLKCETSVICVLAERITSLLRKRDPLCENVKLGKMGVIGATMTGIARAWF